MGGDWRLDAVRREKAALIDPTKPNAARVADYLFGGQSGFEADRRAGRAMIAAAPVVGSIAPAARAFKWRVTRWLVEEADIRQFLAIGTSLPLEDNTHEIAQSRAPECRIVYVDNDPLVLSHARALKKSTSEGAIGYVDADLRDTKAIVAGARTTLDLGQPVAVILPFTLSYIEDDVAAAEVVSSLAAPLPSGSYVAIYHLASDLDATLAGAADKWNRLMSQQRITLRSRSRVASLVAGLELIPPGLVPVSQWRPGSADPRSDTVAPIYGVVARKP